MSLQAVRVREGHTRKGRLPRDSSDEQAVRWIRLPDGSISRPHTPQNALLLLRPAGIKRSRDGRLTRRTSIVRARLTGARLPRRAACALSLFKISHHFVGALVDGVTGAGLVTP